MEFNLLVNKSGRTYKSGVPLSDDMRRLVIDSILKEGGDRATGYFPFSFASVAKTLKLSPNTVQKIWRKFCENYNEGALRPGGDFRSKLTNDDLELIEILKTERGSISLREIYAQLEQFGDIGGDISISAISRAIKSKLLSGKEYSRKKITHITAERFTIENMMYTQLFIDYVSSKDVRTLKFFDEAGVKVPDVGTRLYGHSPVGERCIEIVRKRENPNNSLNMLVSLEGPEYYNVIDGSTDTVQFLNFFEEAANAVNVNTHRPALEVGDIIIMDNFAVHHFEGGEVLEEFLWDMGIELLYMPSYSPDLNPIEMCFNKVKTALNNDFIELVHFNTKLAVETVNANDMRGFYKHTSYLFPL